MTDKPFPWMCGKCGHAEVRPKAIDYKAEIKHDGKLYEVQVSSLEVPTCAHCQTQWFDAHTDDQINSALRQQIGLLQPEEIRARRKAMGLTQKDLAEKIGVAVASLSRWENGSSIQAKSTDNLLRMFFKHPDDRVWTGGDETVTSEPLVEKAEVLDDYLAFARGSFLCYTAIEKLSYPWRLGEHQVSLGDAVSVFALQHDDEDLKQLTFRIAALAMSGIRRKEEKGIKENRLRNFEQLRRKFSDASPFLLTTPVGGGRFYGGGPMRGENPLDESLVGRLLLRPEELSRVSEILKSTDFESIYCRHVYEAMLACFNKHQLLNAEHLLECVRTEFARIEPHRIKFLAFLADRVTSAEPATEIAHMLRNRALVRKQASVD